MIWSTTVQVMNEVLEFVKANDILSTDDDKAEPSDYDELTDYINYLLYNDIEEVVTNIIEEEGQVFGDCPTCGCSVCVGMNYCPICGKKITFEAHEFTS